MEFIKSITCCFPGRLDDEPYTYDEKSSLISAKRAPRTESEIATDVVNALQNAEKHGKTLENTLDGFVKECNWTQYLAEIILAKLVPVVEAFIKGATKISQVLKEAVERAVLEAYDFAKEHPVYCTIIALGVLCLLWPVVLDALGFGEAGIIEGKHESEVPKQLDEEANGSNKGSLAARWQSLYPEVPKGSVFSFLQRLGMTWRH